MTLHPHTSSGIACPSRFQGSIWSCPVLLKIVSQARLWSLACETIFEGRCEVQGPLLWQRDHPLYQSACPAQQKYQHLLHENQVWMYHLWNSWISRHLPHEWSIHPQLWDTVCLYRWVLSLSSMLAHWSALHAYQVLASTVKILDAITLFRGLKTRSGTLKYGLILHLVRTEVESHDTPTSAQSPHILIFSVSS